jgi:DNA polymerase-3 subunit delta
MQIRGDQLAGHLERELRSLYVVYGDDPLLVIEAADAIRARARQQGFSEREILTVLPHFDWNQLLAVGGNLSLFGDRKLIDLRIPTGKPGKDGSAALQDWCRHQSPDNLLLVTLPELDWREEKAAWFTALANAGMAIKLTAPPLAELPAWIAGRFRRQHQSADLESLKFIAERVEGNLLAAHQEIQKLGLLHPAGQLSPEQIRDAVLDVARYDIDGLREALLAGDVARLTRTLDGLMHEGEPPPLVLWAMSEEIRALTVIRAGIDQGRPLDGLLRDAKVWGPRLNPVKKALQRLSTATLEAALEQAGRVDRLIKGVGQGNVWQELLRLGVMLGTAGSAKGGATHGANPVGQRPAAR